MPSSSALYSKVSSSKSLADDGPVHVIAEKRDQLIEASDGGECSSVVSRHLLTLR